jgi:pimeloyl-ACP methyl ester carboxylesterase
MKKPPLVLVHGIDGCANETLAFVRPYLGGKYELIAYDLLGRGKMLGDDHADHSLDAYVRQLARVAAGIRAPFFLLGFSMGGAIAAAYAMRFPARVRKMCLVCPAGRATSAGAVSTYAPYWAWRLAFPALAAAKVEASIGGASGRLDGLIASKKELYRDDRFMRMMYETLRQFPFHDMPLRRVNVSSLVLAGDSDDIVSRDGVAEFAREIGSSVKWYAANHALPLKKPRVVTTAIDKFFSVP